MWDQNEVSTLTKAINKLSTSIKTIPLGSKKDLSSAVKLGNFFGFNKHKKAAISPQKSQTNSSSKKDGITIVIENGSLKQLNFKASKSWSGKTGIYQIPASINPGELVAFDFRRESIKGNQGVVIYQIIDPNPHQKEYVLIMGWSKPYELEPLHQAFVKIMDLEDYQNITLENIHDWLDQSSGQSQSIANGYSASAKAITKGSLPLWVNCLTSH
ncbi:hypothetical protein PCC8801_1240 [Rippkaea orientalis PCC 8801]|uniref:Uncharacterized protein n=1 Tax=Rippkaea orientalis (strain PCC 8801 / RF-1) TaxID=41431 RepID=B7K3G4_RIPO1|nr:hypothetical protein [Rippkaea orientalis]ACK65306.1 hypothetical protein PCC8801_1240 [Rippkaea orientalis PCC 8801]